MNTVKERKLGYCGHIIRNQKYVLMQFIIGGKIEGRKKTRKILNVLA